MALTDEADKHPVRWDVKKYGRFNRMTYSNGLVLDDVEAERERWKRDVIAERCCPYHRQQKGKT